MRITRKEPSEIFFAVAASICLIGSGLVLYKNVYWSAFFAIFGSLFLVKILEINRKLKNEPIRRRV